MTGQSGAGLLLLAFVVTTGCKCSEDPKGKPDPSPTATASAAASSSADAPTTPVAELPASLVGSTITRSPDGAHLYVADETASKLRIVTLPLKGDSSVVTVDLPGPPAQVVATASRVWVTIRDPGLLWIGDTSDGTVTPVTQVSLPNDAWGLALDAELKRAVVTSAWSSQVSSVDLEAARVLWSKAVAREPRGVSIAKDGSWALVTHLIGSELTRISLLAEGTSKDLAEPERVPLSPAPLREPGRTLAASLGYAGVLSPDDSRYFVARHALGALGKNSWFGAATVDVLQTDTWKPLSPERPPQGIEAKSTLAQQLISGSDTQFPGPGLSPFVQPRAIVYRSSTQTVLVASEGTDSVAEFDALAIDPTMALIHRYTVGDGYHPTFHVAGQCAAPSGLVLSRDENTAWIHCAATNDLAELQLLPPNTNTPEADAATAVTARLKLAEDPLGPGGATGRKLFFNATDFPTSGGLACAGCHPEGRDDGYVWHEASFTTEDGDTTNFVGNAENIPAGAHAKGYARRTPFLAGRVNAEGPYGWHAESPNIPERVLAGFGLHRWGAVPERPNSEKQTRARALFDFLRRGLRPPALDPAPLTEAELRGKELFSSKEVGCAECHPADRGFTTRKVFPLPLTPLRDGFARDPNALFKIPGLTFLLGRAPYFHDGSANTLRELLETNNDRMGKTNHLSSSDTDALLAYLERL